MCQWCVLYGKKVDRLPACDTTFLLPASYMEDDTLEKIVDWDTAENLPRNLADQFPARLVPMKTTGDGNCLLHAVSRAIFGVELYYDLLRTSMYEELLANMEWYCKAAPQFGDEDWKRILDNASRSGSYLEFMHIFALANVIARPILIYANDADTDKFGQGESGVAATFVPSRVGRAGCKQRPVVLAWQSKAKNHYVPIVEITGRDAVEWPALAPAFPNSLPTEETYDDYIHARAEVIEPPLLKMLEQQRAEREKQQELVGLLSRAFTGQATRNAKGKGKEKKRNEVTRYDEMEEEDEAEEEEDEEEEGMNREGVAALNELKNYLKRYEEEQKKEEEDARKKMMEILERAKREREEQLKREIAKRPRKEKLAWRGKIYDMVCMVDLGDSLPRIVAWNKSDDIPQTAQAFMDEHGVRDREKYTQLVQLMTRKTLLFMMEELARGEEGGGDAEDGEGGDAEAALGEETKQGSPGRKVPTGLLPSSAPVPSVTPLPICRHIPKRRGAPVLYTNGQLDGIHKKLLQFNGELALETSTSSQSANAAELELIGKTLNTLRDVSAYASTSFQEPEFQLIGRKLLNWPAPKLFPVLDILRLLILHPRAAEHYLAVHTGNSFLLHALLDRLLISAQNPQANCMIALKFFANMFAHPALEGVAAKNAVVILEALVPLASTKDQRLKLPVANVVLNFSSVLCDETSMTDGKRCALGLIKQMLQGEEDTETLYPLLVSLGTLMYCDRESTAFVAGLDVEGVVKRHLTSTNAKIAEVAKDVLDLLKWK